MNTEERITIPSDVDFLVQSGITVTRFTEYHYRALGEVDIYPTTKRIMKKGVSGSVTEYLDKEDLLEKIKKLASTPFFPKKKVATKKTPFIWFLRGIGVLNEEHKLRILHPVGFVTFFLVAPIHCLFSSDSMYDAVKDTILW